MKQSSSRFPTNFYILKLTSGYVFLEDASCVSGGKTITNGAEEVLERLEEFVSNAPKKRVFYFDSNGELTELLHDNWKFLGFGFFPDASELLTADDESLRVLGRLCHSNMCLKTFFLTGKKVRRQ